MCVYIEEVPVKDQKQKRFYLYKTGRYINFQGVCSEPDLLKSHFLKGKPYEFTGKDENGKNVSRIVNLALFESLEIIDI